MSALGTRAVLRSTKILAGQDWETCPHCGDHVKFAAPKTLEAQRRHGLPAHTHFTICNIYVDGRWDRVEHWHHSCYLAAGQPHGQETE